MDFTDYGLTNGQVFLFFMLAKIGCDIVQVTYSLHRFYLEYNFFLRTAG